MSLTGRLGIRRWRRRKSTTPRTHPFLFLDAGNAFKRSAHISTSRASHGPSSFVMMEAHDRMEHNFWQQGQHKFLSLSLAGTLAILLATSWSRPLTYLCIRHPPVSFTTLLRPVLSHTPRERTGSHQPVIIKCLYIHFMYLYGRLVGRHATNIPGSSTSWEAFFFFFS